MRYFRPNWLKPTSRKNPQWNHCWLLYFSQLFCNFQVYFIDVDRNQRLSGLSGPLRCFIFGSDSSVCVCVCVGPSRTEGSGPDVASQRPGQLGSENLCRRPGQTSGSKHRQGNRRPEAEWPQILQRWERPLLFLWTVTICSSQKLELGNQRNQKKSTNGWDVLEIFLLRADDSERVLLGFWVTGRRVSAVVMLSNISVKKGLLVNLDWSMFLK